MEYTKLLNEYEEAVLDETVEVPTNTFTEHEITFINCYVRAWYASYTELSYEGVGKMKRRAYTSDDAKMYEIMLYFKHEAQRIEHECTRLEIMYKMRFEPENVALDEEILYYMDPEEIYRYNQMVEDIIKIGIKQDSFDADEKWIGIKEHVRKTAMFIVLQKLGSLEELAGGNEQIIRSELRKIRGPAY